ncbi:hypothetical protein AVEN_232110-1 [Araneus ventricosus]|uniref:Uncharacterized protein n=1 Tax=Araneus ventricosus TaxID=182803 RepID=A0A4Y2FV98_ARAVE|nr:hypothetical protein AVEN_232110-1 [Araneus ventricosus]
MVNTRSQTKMADNADLLALLAEMKKSMEKGQEEMKKGLEEMKKGQNSLHPTKATKKLIAAVDSLLIYYLYKYFVRAALKNHFSYRI